MGSSVQEHLVEHNMFVPIQVNSLNSAERRDHENEIYLYHHIFSWYADLLHYFNDIFHAVN